MLQMRDHACVQSWRKRKINIDKILSANASSDGVNANPIFLHCFIIFINTAFENTGKSWVWDLFIFCVLFHICLTMLLSMSPDTESDILT